MVKAKIHINDDKLLGYLLSETHLIGRSKAKFFKKLGFHEENLTQIKESLANHFEQGAIQTVETKYGKKYVVDGILKAPIGKNYFVRTVWMEAEVGEIKFVTAYPMTIN